MSQPYKLTDSDLASLKYHWHELGELERYSDWDKIKSAIEREHPELIKAYNDYKTSILIMNAVMRSLDA